MAAAPLPPTSAPLPAPEPACAFRRRAHCQHFHRALENFHRPATECELVGTVAADLHLLAAFRVCDGPADRLRPDQQERDCAFLAGRSVRQASRRSTRRNRSAFTATFIRYLSYGTPVMLLLYFAITTVVLWATFNFGAGANVPFKTAYAIMFYASLPGIISVDSGHDFDVCGSQSRRLST